MNRTVIILVALLLTILTGCSNTPERSGIAINRVQMPEWATTGEHPDYPRDKYIVAYGLARNPKEASEVATERLESEICGYVLYTHKTLFEGTQFIDVATRPAAWFTLQEFGNGIVRDDVNNGFEAVAMRAINKNELKLRAKSMLPDASRKLSDAGMPPAGAGTIEQRMQLWGDFFLLAVRVVALELLADNTLNRTALDKLEEAALSLWELPALIKLTKSGESQVAAIGGGTPEEIVLWATFRGKLVPGLPLEWGPGPGFRAVVEGDLETSDQGRAGARVLYMQPTGDEFGYISARIDLDRFMGQRLGLDLNVWLWRVVLPSRTNSEVVLKLTETRGGEPEGFEPYVQEQFKVWCRGRKFNVVENEPTEDERSYRVAIEGTLDVTSSVVNRIPSAYASGKFVLKDLSTDNVLFRYTLGTRVEGAEGNSEEALILTARNQGTAELLLEIATRLLATLPGPDSEFGRGK